MFKYQCLLNSNKFFNVYNNNFYIHNLFRLSIICLTNKSLNNVKNGGKPFHSSARFVSSNASLANRFITINSPIFA